MLMRGVCSALQAAHEKGIIHRDLKPDNLFLIPDPDSPLGERVKLLDFGIAKLTDIGLAGTATKTGAVMGTPTYMSPEQCRGTGDVDARADLYSLGCMLYEEQIVCGFPPFQQPRRRRADRRAPLHVQPDPPSRYEPNISHNLEALIMSLLAKRPELRPQSAADLSVRLGAIAGAHGYTVRPTLPTGLPTIQAFPPLDDDHPNSDDEPRTAHRDRRRTRRRARRRSATPARR